MSGTLRSSLAEFAGTFALVWLAASPACAGSPLGAALAYGLALLFATFAFASMDAHFNPALTIALWGVGRLETTRGVFLVVSQLLGAGLAGLFLTRTFQEHAPAAVCSLSVGFRMGTLVEAMTTFWLVFVYCKARVERKDALGCVALGAVAAGAALATGPLTGGAFNPARAFGPALATGIWAQHYVFWVGPLVGAYTAAVFYERLFEEKTRLEA